MQYSTYILALLITYTCICRAENNQQQQQTVFRNKEQHGEESTKAAKNNKHKTQNNNNNINRNQNDAETQIIFTNTLQTEDILETFTSTRMPDMIQPQNYIVQNVAQDQVTENQSKPINTKTESNESTIPLLRSPIEQLRVVKEQAIFYNKLKAEHQRLTETNQTLMHFHDNFTLAKNEFMITWATAYLLQFPAFGNSTLEAGEQAIMKGSDSVAKALFTKRHDTALTAMVTEHFSKILMAETENMELTVQSQILGIEKACYKVLNEDDTLVKKIPSFSKQKVYRQLQTNRLEALDKLAAFKKRCEGRLAQEPKMYCSMTAYHDTWAEEVLAITEAEKTGEKLDTSEFNIYKLNGKWYTMV